ncbi:AraC family transcriptional regulator [Winogradskyella sp. J14-2]|uniref:helix-turn-helix domain-containing protein n=1 Tax=Winogradskyella sp. J14-2 TaxID=1936080 RepID=UPI0009729AC9|nr:helix-turn-helix domain-containing protein [Winogradskyella sp. J14-2]APY09717.1 AraC family transcriptional regulator [Winogradskyella sp. J14-2]
MQFIVQKDYNHTFFRDVIRINYNHDVPLQCINDYGYSYIMIRYGKFDAYDYKNNPITIPKIFVKGTGDYFNVKAYEDSVWISVELPNHALHNITNLIARNCRNKLIDLNDYVDTDCLDRLYYELYDSNTIADISTVLDKHLYTYYKTWNTSLDSTLIVNYIHSMRGCLTVKDLSERFPFSERTIERMFKKEVGASPYRFICLVRFNNIIREFQEQKIHLEDLIVKYNYYDNSHFEKDFKKFLGQSIKSYKNNFNPLLSNALSREYHKEKHKS